MRRVYLLLSLAVLLSISCTKNSGSNQAGVWVRVENKTGTILNEVSIGTTEFGDVQPLGRTEYKKMNTPIYAGYCEFEVNDSRRMAGNGVCGTPLPPEFEDGYYTFTVQGSLTGNFPVEVTKQ